MLTTKPGAGTLYDRRYERPQPHQWANESGPQEQAGIGIAPFARCAHASVAVTACEPRGTEMATIMIRNFSEEAKLALRKRAASNDRSMEAEARAILEEAVLSQSNAVWDFIQDVWGLGVDLELPDRWPSRPPHREEA